MARLFLNSKTVKLDIYEACKYTMTAEEAENCKTVEYPFCAGFDIVNGEQAGIADTDGTCIDEHDEYLVLFFEDGDTATFRNSHVDLFTR